MKNIIQLKQKDISILKDELYEKQNGICPILKQVTPKEKMVIDHLHKLKSEIPDESGKGCVRGCIEFRCNALEGKITNYHKRMGLDKLIPLPTLLRNLADYLENNMLKEETLYIHPSEAPKKLILKKSSYNKLKKLYETEKKTSKKRMKDFPAYTGKFTVFLAQQFDKYKLNPELS